jgi:hypothetical protein
MVGTNLNSAKYPWLKLPFVRGSRCRIDTSAWGKKQHPSRKNSSELYFELEGQFRPFRNFAFSRGEYVVFHDAVRMRMAILLSSPTKIVPRTTRGLSETATDYTRAE